MYVRVYSGSRFGGVSLVARPRMVQATHMSLKEAKQSNRKFCDR